MSHAAVTGLPARRRAIVAVLSVASVAITGCGGSRSGNYATRGAPAAATTTAATTGAPAVATPGAGTRTQQVMTLTDGAELHYTLVLPKAYRPGRRSPVLLALPPGGQGQEEVDALLDRWWALEAERRGWIVVSPVAPGGRLFYSGPSSVLLELMDRVATMFPPEGGRFHLAGVSNGGLSAFRIAIDAPERFSSILVAPGFPPEESDRAKLGRLARIPVAFFVGGEDTGWREPSEETAAELRRLGGTARVTVSPGEGHILQRVTGPQLFGVLEASRR